MDQGITLICGDALEVMRGMPSGEVALVVTDPPYNLNKDYGTGSDNRDVEEYVEFTRAWVKEAMRVLRPDGALYVCMGMRFIARLYMILEGEGLHFNSWITWHYTQGIGKTRGFSPRHDDILYFTMDAKRYTFNLDDVRVPQKYYRSINNMRGANPGNVWEFAHVHYCNKNRWNHPTQKPEALFERMVLASSNEGDLVLDPFVGSGTTARVCQQTRRRCIGVDNNAGYIEMSRQRLSESFVEFDSIDERACRLPQNMHESKGREEYLRKHRQWFLKNHAGRQVREVVHEENLPLFSH